MSAEDLATSPHVWPWRSERSRKARAVAARTYLNRPLLHNATNGGAGVGRRKGAKDGAKYRAQKHAEDQALLASSQRSSSRVRARHALKPGRLLALSQSRLSSSHTKISTNSFVLAS